MDLIGDAGLTKAQLQAAFSIDSSIDISTFNALADALNKGASGPGLAVLKVAATCFSETRDFKFWSVFLAGRNFLCHQSTYGIANHFWG